MNFPRMSPRRWLWTLLAAAFCWSAAGWHWNSDAGRTDDAPPGAMRSTQGFFTGPVKQILMPASWIFTQVQSRLSEVVARATSPTPDATSVEALQAKVTRLEYENQRLKALVDKASEMLRADATLLSVGIAAGDKVNATVTGSSAGPGTAVLHVDKGSNAGVKVGAPVLALGDGVCVVGKVDSVSMFQSDVKLVTDPGSRIRVQLFRQQARQAPPGERAFDYVPITTSPHLLQGKGSASPMYIDDINSNDPAQPKPAKGDLVCLTDNTWWTHAQFMVVGVVDEITTRQDQPLRYFVYVKPATPIVTQRTLVVLLKE